MGEFVRHAKMTAWGTGIVIEDRGGQRTVLFADGSKRSFKGEIAAKLLIPAEPESEEERVALERGAGAGGAAPMPVNLALESQLSFSDPQPFLVYADWLEQRGDPRGKLIHAQHRGTAKLERELLKEHAGVLVPPNLGKRYKLEVEWKLGFIASARAAAGLDDERLEAFLQHPSVALLHELAIEDPPTALLSELKPRRLARITIGAELATNTTAVRDLAPLCTLPSLAELHATGDRVVIAYPLVSQTLKELSITTRRSDTRMIRHVLTSELPALERLSIECLDGIDDGVPPNAFAKLPGLRSITLVNTTRTRSWLEALLSCAARESLTEIRLLQGDLGAAPPDLAALIATRIPSVTTLEVTANREGRERRIRTPPVITPAALAIARPAAWEEVAIDVTQDRVWGTYPGTVGNYAVAIERDSDWAQCSCPSNDRPCKHALALHAMLAAGTALPERVPPGNHYQLSSRRRFAGIRE